LEGGLGDDRPDADWDVIAEEMADSR
jgi:hypothetical protein